MTEDIYEEKRKYEQSIWYLLDNVSFAIYQTESAIKGEYYNEASFALKDADECMKKVYDRLGSKEEE